MHHGGRFIDKNFYLEYKFFTLVLFWKFIIIIFPYFKIKTLSIRRDHILCGFFCLFEVPSRFAAERLLSPHPCAQ